MRVSNSVSYGKWSDNVNTTSRALISAEGNGQAVAVQHQETASVTPLVSLAMRDLTRTIVLIFGDPQSNVYTSPPVLASAQTTSDSWLFNFVTATKYRIDYGFLAFCNFQLSKIQDTTQAALIPMAPPVYSWMCCKCNGANSCEVDAGCANCCNHWQCDKCDVYIANGK